VETLPRGNNTTTRFLLLNIKPLTSISVLIFSDVPVCDSRADCMPPVKAALDFSCAIGHSTTGVANDSFQNEKGSYV